MNSPVSIDPDGSLRYRRLARFLRNLGLLSGLLPILFATTTLRAQEDVRLELEKKAEFWAQNGREDLAAQTYHQILFLYPSNREALIGLAEASILTGHKTEARQYIQRILSLNPKDPSLLFFSREMALGPRWTEDIRNARLEDSRHAYQKSIAAFRKAFGPLPPPPNFAVEYYHVLQHLPGGKEKALAELEDLVRRYPQSLHYRLAYGEILSYHPSMRHEAIRTLKPLALAPSSVSKNAQQDWRRTLVWAGDDPAFLPEMSDYIERFPDPRLEALRSRARERHLQVGPRPRKAYRDLHAGRFREAREQFLELLRQDPGNGSYRIGLASAYFGERRFRDASHALAEARNARLDPKDVKNLRSLERGVRFWSMMDEGRKAQSEGDDGYAIDRFRKAAEIEPDNPAVLDALAGLELKKGNPRKALSLAQKALRLRPEDSHAWTGVLSALVAEKRYWRARKFLNSTPAERIRTLETADPGVLIAEGTVYVHTGNPTTAERKFQEALRTHPNLPPSQEIALAWGFYTLRKDPPLSRIVGNLDQKKDLSADENRQVETLQHLLLLHQVNRELARNAFSAALARITSATRAHPGDPFYPRTSAAVYLASGKPETAFRIVKSLGPGSSLDSYGESIRIAIQARHLQQAEDWADQARKKWPGRARTAIIRARVLAARGETKRARRFLLPALRKDPQNPRLRLGLAEIDLAENRLPEARKGALLALELSRNMKDDTVRTKIARDAQNTLDAVSRQEQGLNGEHFEFLLGETVFSQYTQYYYTQIGGFFPVGTARGVDGVTSPIYLHAFVYGSAFTFKYHPTSSSSSFLSQTYFGGTPAIGVKLPTPFGSWEGDVGWGIAQHDQTLSPPGTVTGLFLQTDLLWKIIGGDLDLFANYTGYINYIYFQSRYIHPSWASAPGDLTFGLGPEFIIQGNQNYSAYMGGAAFRFFVRPLRSTLLLDTGILGSSAFPGIGGYEGFSWYFYY